MKFPHPLILTSLFFAFSATAALADVPAFNISIKDHRFTPAEVHIPANEKVKLIIKNEDPTPEEFESHDLNREKIVAGNSQIIVFVGPLKSGEYKFFGEFNEATAQGKVIVK